jgi:hypothetical protein
MQEIEVSEVYNAMGKQRIVSYMSLRGTHLISTLVIYSLLQGKNSSLSYVKKRINNS